MMEGGRRRGIAGDDDEVDSSLEKMGRASLGESPDLVE
jgi:hypothetical protein